MDKEDHFHLGVLNEELRNRVAANSRYSLRRFAKVLNMSTGLLSEILNGRRPLSLKKAEAIMETLQLDPLQRRQFLSSVMKLHNSRKLLRTSQRIKQYNFNFPQVKVYPNETDHKALGDWFTYAILNLTNTRNFNPKPSWIASQLNITASEAMLTFNYLKVQKAITFKSGRWSTNPKLLITRDSKTPDQYRKKLQKQIRLKAVESIEHSPAQEQIMSNATFLMNENNFKVAGNLIEKFQKDLISLCKDTRSGRVYAIEVGLFPLQKKQK